MHTVYYAGASLDGYIAKADGGIGWLLEAGPQEPGTYEAFFDTIDGLIMGRTTYDQITSSHPWYYGDTPTWILTHRSLPPREEPILAIGGAPAAVHAEIAAAGVTNLWIVGGGDVAGQWMRAGLIDRVVVTYVPIALGQGIPLFAGLDAPVALRCQEAVRYANGFVEVTYATR